jgi:osomolarity two-component system response regulator SKN7
VTLFCLDHIRLKLEISGKMNQLPANDSPDGGDGSLMFLEAPETQRMLRTSIPGSDIARATLMQMSEISRHAEARGVSFFPALGSPIDNGGRSSEAQFDASEIHTEDLQAQVVGSSSPRLDIPLFNTSFDTPQNLRLAIPESIQDAQDEMVLPTPTSQLSSSSDAGILPAWDAHAGLEVYTVGHLMPRGNGDLGGNQVFDGGAMAGNQNASGASQGTHSASRSPRETQTLRVRRSAFVPGWAVPPRVLLVDDDAVTRKLSSKFLQVFGCTTDIAVDGVGAVNKMNLEKYDLVLMVQCLSRVSGFFGSW